MASIQVRSVKLRPLVAVVIAAPILTSACADTTPETLPTSISSTSTYDGSSSQEEQRTREIPAVLHKQIGERAGIGCPDGAGATPCDVEFAITAIQSNVQDDCEDPYGIPIGADEQMLRFDIEVWTAQQFSYPDQVDSVLFLENWGVGDAEGVDNNLRDHIAIRCDGELTGDQISKFLVPGTHVAKSIFVTAPKGATTLRLYSGPRGDGWTWTIPPAS